MNELEFNDLIDIMKDYSKEEIEQVTKAYKYADNLHNGQLRQSGEPYIIHPLNVCYTLAEMHADSDTLCAALLHDVIEDTPATYEDIENEFNPVVAKLVDGVTKISNIDFSSKMDQNYANTRKIINGLTEDVRIIIIKLSDRLHNMKTLQFKSPAKQKEKSIETMEIFAPLAYCIGAYRIKCELEDLAFMYLNPEEYNSIKDKKESVVDKSDNLLKEMLATIHNILNDRDIPNEIKFKTKNIYGIYKKLNEGNKLSDIHDLLALRVMVENINDCYQTLGVIHSKYRPLNTKFKDYIYNPKSNMYRSLHTTVFGAEDRLIQARIRTFEMDAIASYGLSAYWYYNKNQATEKMQDDLKTKWKSYDAFMEIKDDFDDNEEFVTRVKKEVFSSKVYVYTPRGDMIELPKGATVVDFAYKIHTDVGNTMVSAVVNDEVVPIGYELKNNDIVRIITDDLSYGSREGWINNAHTSYAKRKIKEFNKK